MVDDGEKEDKMRKEEEKLQDWLWWRDLVSNLAYAPMTMHWSMEGGMLSDWGVGALGRVVWSLVERCWLMRGERPHERLWEDKKMPE